MNPVNSVVNEKSIKPNSSGIFSKVTKSSSSKKVLRKTTKSHRDGNSLSYISSSSSLTPSPPTSPAPRTPIAKRKSFKNIAAKKRSQPILGVTGILGATKLTTPLGDDLKIPTTTKIPILRKSILTNASVAPFQRAQTTVGTAVNCLPTSKSVDSTVFNNC